MASFMRVGLAGLSFAALLQCSAADGHLVAQSKWRTCSGYATNIKYITGTGLDYAPSWAGDVSRNALLDAGKNSSAELEAACDALLEDGQIGEIYQMDPTKAGNCTNCLRMAIYSASEAGLLVGTVADTGSQQKWTCGKGVPPPVQPSCTVSAQSKWRPCSGFATNIKYITGTGVDYSPSWAGTASQSDLLKAGMNSEAELEAACNALLQDGQVGEIYTMDSDNANGCTDCLRMAIYAEAEAGMVVGTVADTGSQAKWVCGKSGRPPVRPECPTTCGEIKEAYKASGCCGNPNAQFQMSSPRRMAQNAHGEELLRSVKDLLAQTRAESPAKAVLLVKRIETVLNQL